MNTTLLVIVLIALVVVLVAVAYVLADRRRSERLRARFGPEYDRTVRSRDDRRKAEAELEARRQRVERLKLRDLSLDEAAQFRDRWRGVQARFVDDPPGAVLDADTLVEDAMGARGYPVADFAQQADDISVNHPRVVSDYRAAHATAEKQERTGATTEELRQAMVHYRSLFEDLIGTGDTAEPSPNGTTPPRGTPANGARPATPGDRPTRPVDTREPVDSATGRQP